MFLKRWLCLGRADLKVLMKSLNLGQETGHEHENDEHVDHDHSGLRRRQRSRRDQRSRNERNATWDQVGILQMVAILQEPLPNIGFLRDDFSRVLMRWISLPVGQLCFSAEELIQIHELGANTSSGMGRSGLARLSPALVQQILSGACTNTADSHASDGLGVTESQCLFWPLMVPNLLLNAF